VLLGASSAYVVLAEYQSHTMPTQALPNVYQKLSNLKITLFDTRWI